MKVEERRKCTFQNDVMFDKFSVLCKNEWRRERGKREVRDSGIFSAKTFTILLHTSIVNTYHYSS